MIVRKTRPEEYRRVNELFAICFESPYSNCPIDPEHDECDHWAAYDDCGEMMSSFTIPTYTIRFDGSSCKMGGIGGVATLPQYRRRGGVRACFNAALPDLYANGYDFSYLYPFSTAYYRKFGYECCVQRYGWTVDLSQLNPPRVEGAFHMAEKHHPLGDAVRSIDRVWEQQFNMMVQHGEEDYTWANEADPAGKQEFTCVWFDAAGAPKSYTTFKTVSESDGRNLICSRFCFVDRDGFAGLMQILKSLSADHAFAKFSTPALPALQYLMPEWSLGAVTWNIQASSGMVRVVNVKAVLEKARYLGTGKVSLAIRDPQIPENNGTFTVAFADGRAVSVEHSQSEPDAVLDIPAFSALIAGVWDFAEAQYTFSGLEVRRNNESLRQVFYRKPLYIVDYF